jgi:hypothetical protein
MGGSELKGTPDRSICASFTYTPTLPANGALPGHTTFHVYHHPKDTSSTSYFLFQTIPITSDIDKHKHLTLLSDPAHTGLAFSSRRHGGWTSEAIRFYRGANPEDSQSVVHRATIGELHGRGLSGLFNFGKEINFEKAVAYPDGKCYNYETPGGIVKLEEKTKKWGTQCFYHFSTPQSQVKLFWRTSEVSTPDPANPDVDERDRWTQEGHMSCYAMVGKTIKGDGLRREETEMGGITVARFVKPINHDERQVRHKLGRIELVWEGCERVWGFEWDRKDIVETVLMTGMLVAVEKGGSSAPVPVPTVV